MIFFAYVKNERYPKNKWSGLSCKSLAIYLLIGKYLLLDIVVVDLSFSPDLVDGCGRSGSKVVRDVHPVDAPL